MIKVTNDAGNLILEVPESTLAFYQRAGYHKVGDKFEKVAEKPAELPAEEQEAEGDKLGGIFNRGGI
jgi:hypothetical protein